MFKLRGIRPKDLGARDGRFSAARSWKPNWVSSQVDAGDPHYIAPLQVAGDANAAIEQHAVSGARGGGLAVAGFAIEIRSSGERLCRLGRLCKRHTGRGIAAVASLVESERIRRAGGRRRGGRTAGPRRFSRWRRTGGLAR